MYPYASIIIPTHDRAATLPIAVASVQRQTVSDIEIIIVGDGPTSDVAAAAEGLSRADSRVRFCQFEKTPRHRGINNDRGVHEARSERIFYIDDDDVWLPQHVETIGPHLDDAHIADTLPVSVGTVMIGPQHHLHGTLVNSGNRRTRSLLAEDRLKLIYDSHLAHRKSAYIELGCPWRGTGGIAVCRMLAAFAADSRIRWTTVPTTTALSLHGAARIDATPKARRAEIETCLEQSASWTPDTLLRRADFTWHFTRMLFTEVPLAGETVASYFARFGINWGSGGSLRMDGEPRLLTIPLNDGQRHALELIFDLFQGFVHDRSEALDSVLLSLLDCVQGGGIPVHFAQRILKPYGISKALEICSHVRHQSGGIYSQIDLLETHLLLDARNVVEARARAARLKNDGKLASHELTRLLARCDLTEGGVGSAINRLKGAWLPKANLLPLGIDLASLLISDARLREALAVCLELKRLTSLSLLDEMLATLNNVMVDQDSVPAYRLSQHGVLLTPHGIPATISNDSLGHVDRVHFDHEFAFISGWAVDLKKQQPALRVVAIVNGLAQGVASPRIHRRDVAAALQLPGVEVSGYLMAARLPRGLTPSRTKVRVFSILADGGTRELNIPSNYSSTSPADPG
jgi:hypothetical protein